jgi:phospholipid transport system substrate-binding protein
MNEAQKIRYVDAFSHYISVIYARRFDDFGSQPEIALGRTIDAGRKGLLIESPMVFSDGKKVAVEWLVSDRGGKVEIIDLVIEGISMAATQREEIGAMIDKRRGDFDVLIAHLAATS